jgi:predicted nucleic acid-binding protein
LIAFDANVLVYASDPAAEDKHRLASAAIGQAILDGSLFLPLQVLGEFANVALRKLGHTPQVIDELVLAWSAGARLDGYGLGDVRRALQANQDHDLPFWDALVWAVCDRCGATTLATEDFQDGRRLGSVMFLNPFNPANAARLGLDRS